MKGHIVDVRPSKHQRADSGCERHPSLSNTHSFSVTLSATHTHTHTHSSAEPPEDPKNIMVYCSPSQPKNNIWNRRVNSERGQRSHSDTAHYVCERVKSEIFLFPPDLTLSSKPSLTDVTAESRA